MKLSKFVKRAKSESYCMVIHADDSGIWLGTRLALYNATELPEMEGKEQVGAVLDIDSKAWEKMFFDEKYAETAGAAFGVNLTDADPLEQEARRVPLEMFYKGMGLVGLTLCAGVRRDCGRKYAVADVRRGVPAEIDYDGLRQNRLYVLYVRDYERQGAEQVPAHEADTPGAVQILHIRRVL